MNLLPHSIESFLITVLTEGVVLFLFFKEFRSGHGLLACLLVNMVTHPMYFAARHHFFPHEHWLKGLFVLEPVVVLFEAVVYRSLLTIQGSRAVIVSFAANVFSLLTGLLTHFSR